MRLNKALSQLGFCSRRKGDSLILRGEVKVNQNTVYELGKQVKLEDEVTVGKITRSLAKLSPRRIWLYYKPKGVITTHHDPQGRITVFDLLKSVLPERVISVGRLDYQSEGLLLLTNDNFFAHQAEKSNWKRHYRVRFWGDLLPRAIEQIRLGLTLNGIHYAPIDIELLPSTGRNHWSNCILTEGKNREIRKIFAHFQLKVNRLIRVQYGPYCLENLKPGECRCILSN